MLEMNSLHRYMSIENVQRWRVRLGSIDQCAVGLILAKEWTWSKSGPSATTIRTS